MLVVAVAEQKTALTDDVDESENCSTLSCHCWLPTEADVHLVVVTPFDGVMSDHR